MKVWVEDQVLGEAVAKRRGLLGLSQEQLAERAGVSSAMIAQLELNQIKAPRVTTVIAIAESLETTVTHLLQDAGMIKSEPAEMAAEIAAFAERNPKFAIVAHAAMDDPELLRRFYEFIQMYQGERPGKPPEGQEEDAGSSSRKKK